MHPGFISYWRRRHYARNACATAGMAGRYAPHGAGDAPGWAWMANSQFGDALFGAGGFGTRRPVRFLAERLELDDPQVAKLAKILERLRVEREQGAVDLRRAAGALADAFEGPALDAAHLDEATRLRVEAAKRVQQAVAGALRELHELLGAEQREELASLIRSGALRL
jgi:Spy/CpxP family protein refolding chaperone